ncbi:NAD(+) synthase [candidate division KSB1 bacterium]|nr:NAD(+) synthase [candidate division KSB1 bacterium]
MNNNIFAFNAEKKSETIAEWLRQSVFKTLKKRGAVVGVSGGIDSAVVAALCVKALGRERVSALALPEKESNPESLTLAEALAAQLGIPLQIEDITGGLVGMGAYKRRNSAVKSVFPQYDEERHTFKIILQSDPLHNDWLNVFRLVITDKNGEENSIRLPLQEYLQIVAASNMKQRLRMVMLYYHAEKKNYAVVGTGNKNEHQLGFFVKFGDGGADLKPVAHLYKTNIYQLAKHLSIPETIIQRPPTTDTYPAEVTQEEFFFRLSFELMDAIWRLAEVGRTAKAIAAELDLKVEQVQRVLRDIGQKKRTTDYLRLQPLEIDQQNHQNIEVNVLS